MGGERAAVLESAQPGRGGLAGSPPPVPGSSRPELPLGAATAGVGLWSYRASPSCVGEDRSDKPQRGALDTVAAAGGGRFFCKQPCYYLSAKLTPSFRDGAGKGGQRRDICHMVNFL